VPPILSLFLLEQVEINARSTRVYLENGDGGDGGGK